MAATIIIELIFRAFIALIVILELASRTFMASICILELALRAVVANIIVEIFSFGTFRAVSINLEQSLLAFMALKVVENLSLIALHTAAILQLI